LRLPALALGGALLAAAPLRAETYYIDDLGGSDAGSGKGIDQAWKTLAPANRAAFQPGDTLKLRSGGVWAGPLDISRSGTEAAPLVITSYGGGGKPVIEYPDQGQKSAVSLHGDWVILENLAVRKVFLVAISLSVGAEHNVLRDLDISACGLGVVLDGRFNRVTRGHFHDLTMVVSTPGGNDDYGAVGVVIANSDNEVSDSRFIRCIGPSLDYGFDGGAVEIWAGDRDVRNISLLRNYAWRSCGFFEIGGKGHAVEGIRVAHNVLSDCFGLSYTFINNSGDYKVDLKDYRFENNTVVVHACPGEKVWTAIAFDTPSEPGVFTMRNNLFFVPHADRILWHVTAPVAAHNLIWHPGTAFFTPNYTLAPTDIQGKDPLFLDPGTCAADGDYRLGAASPARDAGMDLGAAVDRMGTAVPQGSRTDIGALESGPSVAASARPGKDPYRHGRGLTRSGMAGARLRFSVDGRQRNARIPAPELTGGRSPTP
jgi:hypothetical protein